MHTNSSEFAVASFICGIVTQTVLRADLSCYSSEGGASILQGGGNKILATACLREIIHLTTSQVIKVAADLHTFELTHPAKVYVVIRLGARDKDLAVSLKLFCRKRQASVILAILEQSVLDEILRVNLNKIGRNFGLNQFCA